jgi:hypothetical protein
MFVVITPMTTITMMDVSIDVILVAAVTVEE